MKNSQKLSIALLLLPLLALSCTSRAEQNAKQLSKLKDAIQQIAHEASGRVGAAACLVETGDSVAVADTERYPMQSVYKLPIAMAVLHEGDEGHLRLDQQIEISKEKMGPSSLYSPLRKKFPEGAKLTPLELIRYAVSESDNVASDALLRLAGGPEQVTAYLKGLGLEEMVVATTELEMNSDETAQHRNWATPRDAVNLLTLFHRCNGLSPQSQAFLRDALLQTTTGPRRIKGLLPPETRVAHKTGTSGTSEWRTSATNDIGIVTLPDGRHMAIAVFICDSTAGTEERELTIARIAKAAYDCFSR